MMRSDEVDDEPFMCGQRTASSAVCQMLVGVSQACLAPKDDMHVCMHACMIVYVCMHACMYVYSQDLPPYKQTVFLSVFP